MCTRTSGLHCIYVAVQNGHVSVVEMLIKLRADINAVDKVNNVLIRT